jgi:hypothetical protein
MMPGVSRIEGEVRWAEEDRRMRERASFVRYDLTVGDFPESVREILRGRHEDLDRRRVGLLDAARG